MEISYLDSLNKTNTPWFKSRVFRIVTIFIAVSAVVAVVLFSKQIGTLLELWGLKAAPTTKHITLPAEGQTWFSSGNYTVEPPNSLKIGNIDNREVLMLNQ